MEPHNILKTTEKSVTAFLPDFILLIIIFFFLFLGWSVGPSPQDDAFISFRYARNLASGDGLVFNPGERVEGYTCFLWVVLIAAGMKAGVDPLLFCRILGLASGALLIALFYAFGWRISGGNRYWPLLASIHLAVAGPVVVESVQGMETVFFALLAGAGIYCSLFKFEMPLGLLRGSLLLSAAFLTRPEGILFYLAALSYILSLNRKKRNIIYYFVMPFALTFIGHTMWRYFYYSQILPATFYAKIGWESEQLRRGWHYFMAFLNEIRFWRYVPACCAVFLLRKGVNSPAPLLKGRPLAVCFAVVILSWLYVIAVGGDFKFTFRFFVPGLGFFLILFQEGCRFVFLQFRKVWPPWMAAVLMALFTVISAVNFHSSFHRTWGFARARSKIWLEERAVGLWLKENSHPGALLATGSAGAVPYYSDLPTIDMTGLTDLHISRVSMEFDRRRLPGHEKGDGRYVFEKSPDYILFQAFTRRDERVTLDAMDRYFRTPPRHGIPRSEEELWRLPAFHHNYELKSVEFKHFYFNYFQKKWR